MIGSVLTKVLGTKFDRDRKRLQPLVDEINRLEESYRKLSEEELKNKTVEFKSRIKKKTGELKRQLEEVGERLSAAVPEEEEEELKEEERKLIGRLREEESKILDELLPEAFAVVKNICRRLLGRTWEVCGHPTTWEMVPFDVQLIGAIVLHQGKIAEMATGEGKTLAATMPLYLNALTGKSVHLVTVNDYLALRDREWMGPVFEFLGLTVSCIQTGMDPAFRKEAYGCDITYGTNNEFGFDYLRDNMSRRKDEQVQRKYLYYDPDKDVLKRGHYYTIIDEVDSILIDEARTPLIISGPVTVSTHKFKEIMPRMKELSRRQSLLCSRLLQEGKKLWEEGKPDEGVLMFYQAKKGAPKNKQFLSLLEDPHIRRAIEKNEVELDSRSTQSVRGEEGRALREDLYYTTNERAHEIDITEKGHLALSPDDPEEFVLPDFGDAYQEIKENAGLTDEEKERRIRYLSDEVDLKSEKIHNALTSLRALDLFEKDVSYVIQDNQVIIVDEFTGRLMPGRRYSDGLHQALEAKEGVRIERETQTLAAITIQNYFRMYEKLAGMTGSAETEALEFHKIYGLDVVVIPTNEPVRRNNYNDKIFKTKNEKYRAVIDEIEAYHKKNQPVLVGTISVDTSEVLSRMLRRRKIPHQVLNARYHQKEAEIVSRAGQPGSVTIATNMAGRGTDIKLGPGVVNPDCLEARKRNRERWEKFQEAPWCCLVCLQYQQCRRGKKPLGGKSRQMFECRKTVPCGLHIIATERHEARRIDLQLRGRSARQGDPGSSRFYLSLEDDLMRLFGSDRIAGVMEKLGVEEGEEMTHPLLTRAIGTAQRRVEQHNFSLREHILKYDDVMNKQREEIYAFRNSIIDSAHPRRGIMAIIEEVLAEKLDSYCPSGSETEEWNLAGLADWTRSNFPLHLDLERWSREEGITPAVVRDRIMGAINHIYDLKEEYEGRENMRQLEKLVVLGVIDRLWQEHLYNMDDLRQGITLRAYAQRDPLIEYKQESLKVFSELESNLKQEVAANIFRSSVRPPLERIPEEFIHKAVQAFGGDIPRPQVPPPPEREPSLVGPPGMPPPPVEPGALPGPSSDIPATFRRPGKKIGSNDPCPCGSGKKYKKCCGR